MIRTKKTTLQTISKMLYILGLAILLNGILLSSINVPVNATNGVNTGGGPKVEICHWTQSGKYVSIDVSVNSVDSSADWNSSNGHGNHSSDIWPQFTAQNGDVIAAQGDQSLLGTHCKEPTATSTATRTRTATKTNTPTKTASPTKTSSPTKTATITNTATATNTFTVTNTLTATNTPTVTDTATATYTPTATDTATATATETSTPTPTDTATATETPDPRIVQVCHWIQGNTYEFEEILVASILSSSDWGSTWHGVHENDIWAQFNAKNGDLIEAQGDLEILRNQCVVLPTPTPTPTSTFTQTATSTQTSTPEDEDNFPLTAQYACFVEYMEWSITNPNSFPVEVNWELDPSVTKGVDGLGGKLFAPKPVAFIAALASGVVIINPGQTVVVTTSTPATHVFKISYILGDGEDLTINESTNGSDFCVPKEDPQSTPTTVPTLSQPQAQSGQELIPVTGADLLGVNSQRTQLGRMLSLLGLLTIGFGMILQGISKK